MMRWGILMALLAVLAVSGCQSTEVRGDLEPSPWPPRIMTTNTWWGSGELGDVAR